MLSAVLFLGPAQTGQLPPDDVVRPQELHEVGVFLEGIVFSEDGVGFVSDVQGGTVYRFNPDSAPQVWASMAAPNGHEILDDGTHIVVDMSDGTLVRFDGNGNRIEPPIDASAGDPLTGPNDISGDGDGFYFTDPGPFSPESTDGRIHYSGPDFDPWPVADGLAFPNGIAQSPNGGTLYIAESLGSRILAIQLLTRGLPGRRQTLVDLSSDPALAGAGLPDGLTVDQDGNLYVAMHGDGRVFVVSPSGEIIRRYEAGMISVANLAFSPTEPGRLFLVGSRDAERTQGLITVLDLPGRTGVPR
jgi:gluconolactonase